MNKLNPFKLVLNFILYLSLTSCAQRQKVVSSLKIFPDGQYTQSVQLSIQTKEGLKGIPFTSLSKIDNGNFNILGLTPFGTKAFEAKGHVDNPDKMKLRFFMDVPDFLNKKFVKTTLHTIQKLQKLQRSELVAKNGSQEFKTDQYRLQIYSYTKSGVPREMKLSSPPWTAHISTSIYKAKDEKK